MLNTFLLNEQKANNIRRQEGKGFNNKLVNSLAYLKRLLIKAGFLGYLGKDSG